MFGLVAKESQGLRVILPR